MTSNESFKRRVRERMASTGERYAAARRILVAQSHGGRGRTWVSDPEHSDEVIRTRTGRGWDEWCDLIEAWPGHNEGHGAIAAHVHEAHGIDAWWSQAVTGGYERIVGLRLPNQRLDGTFTASKSKTVGVDADQLREVLLAEDRDDLFGGVAVELRSRPTSKSIRLAIGPGVALISIAPAGQARAKVTVEHEKLASPDEVAEWKFFWEDWLRSLDDS